MKKQPWESQGMMQPPQLDAEADRMATAYEANLARVKAAEARGEVATLGRHLTSAEWGYSGTGRIPDPEDEKQERKPRRRRP